MQHDAGEDQVPVRHRTHAQEATDLRHLRDVLEEAAAIGVMNHLGRRPHAQLRFVIRHHAIQQHAHVIVFTLFRCVLELRPHLVDRPRRAQDRVFLAETLAPILIGIHTTNRSEHELDLARCKGAPPLDAHEFACLELVLVAIDVGHHFRDNLSRESWSDKNRNSLPLRPARSSL